MLLIWYPNSTKCLEDCIVHFIPWSIAQQHNVIVLGLSSYPSLYNRSSANEAVPATVLGPLQRPNKYPRTQYDVNGKVVIHDAAALHRLEFYIHPSRTRQEIAAIIQRPSGKCGGEWISMLRKY